MGEKTTSFLRNVRGDEKRRSEGGGEPSAEKTRFQYRWTDVSLVFSLNPFFCSSLPSLLSLFCLFFSPHVLSCFDKVPPLFYMFFHI